MKLHFQKSMQIPGFSLIWYRDINYNETTSNEYKQLYPQESDISSPSFPQHSKTKGTDLRSVAIENLCTKSSLKTKNSDYSNSSINHPFYRNTVRGRRNSGTDPFENMKRFDSSSQECVFISECKKTQRCLNFYNKINSKKKNRAKSKNLIRNSRRSEKKMMSTQPRIIQLFKKASDCAVNLQKFEKENGKIDIQKLSQTGLWKKIPDLIRNELWIRDRERKLKHKRKSSKKQVMKECTFRPEINQSSPSPFPKYKYYDLEKNRDNSYTK